jgi:hypothetical protein
MSKRAELTSNDTGNTGQEAAGKSIIEDAPRLFDNTAAVGVLSRTLFRRGAMARVRLGALASAFTAPRSTATRQINFMKNMTKSAAHI